MIGPLSEGSRLAAEQNSPSPKKIENKVELSSFLFFPLYVMVSHFPSPVLSLASDAVKDLDGHDALPGLWTGTFLLPHIPHTPHTFFFPFSLSLSFHDCLFPDKLSPQSSRSVKSLSKMVDVSKTSRGGCGTAN